MCRHETRAISSRGGEDKENSVIESAQERNTRLALEDEYFHLEAEIRRLDAIKATRWQQLVMLNQWDSHECDATVISLNEEIEQNRLKQLKVYTLLNENKRKIGERDRGMGKLMSMLAGKESVETQSEEREGSAKISPSASTTQSSCVNQADDGEELNYLLNQDKTVWEEPFVLDSRVHHLIRNNNTEHPNEDNWRLTKEKEVIGSAEGTMGWKQTYQGLSKGIRGESISGVGLKELFESEKRKKERQELNKKIRIKDREVRESRKDIKKGFFEPLNPRFKMAQRVTLTPTLNPKP
jgi:hypothetical protein